MTLALRIVLLLAAMFSSVWIVYRIRRAQVRLEDTLFWIVAAVILAALGLFPQISYWMASLLGIQSPANFIFLIMIGLLFEKVLTMSIINSQMEEKYVNMAAEMALRCKDLERQIEKLKAEVEQKQ